MNTTKSETLIILYGCIIQVKPGWTCVQYSISGWTDFSAFSGAKRSKSSSVWNPRSPDPVFWTASGYTQDECGSDGQLHPSTFHVSQRLHKLTLLQLIWNAQGSVNLHITRISLLSVFTAHQRHLSPLLFLTPRLPSFLMGRRLNSHAMELLLLDRALGRMGPHQLSEAELRQVSHSTQLGTFHIDLHDGRWILLIKLCYKCTVSLSGLLCSGSPF